MARVVEETVYGSSGHTEDKRLKTGVYGLDGIIGGGFRENTVNVVIGSSGAGKTTFAMQYLLYGLNRGERALYLSLEMSEKYIVRECRQMGWTEVEDHINNGDLKVIHKRGEDVLSISRELSTDLLKVVEEYTEPGSRIVIDPLTHLTFLEDKTHRTYLSEVFNGLRELGTSLVLLEESPFPASTELSGEKFTPIYLADSVIHLQSLGFGERYNRTLRIIKHRGSRHGEGLYPISIQRGFGVVAEVSEDEIQRITPKTEFMDRFEDAKARVIEEGSDLKDILLGRIETLQRNWASYEDPTSILELFFNTENE
ncbi:MAG: ATPase domain-containing protein [Halobacteriota archaeon]|nr:ATPase domain-containing protein [Halobacteriota archaeon]